MSNALARKEWTVTSSEKLQRSFSHVTLEQRGLTVTVRLAAALPVCVTINCLDYARLTDLVH